MRRPVSENCMNAWARVEDQTTDFTDENGVHGKDKNNILRTLFYRFFIRAILVCIREIGGEFHHPFTLGRSLLPVRAAHAGHPARRGYPATAAPLRRRSPPGTGNGHWGRHRWYTPQAIPPPAIAG
jgi:hypothetical protein